MKRYTIGQQRALVELRALARTALVVCDALAARGEETDDRPRRYLDALVRWTLGEEKPAQLAAATRAMEEARSRAFTADHKIPLPATATEGVFGDALHWLSDARADLMRNPGHAHHSPRVCRCLADTLQRYDGETFESGRARVAATLAAERKRATAEAVDALANARRVQAKRDKVTAEEALGTLPGMEGR